MERTHTLTFLFAAVSAALASLIYSAQLLAAIASQPSRPLLASIFLPTSRSDVAVNVDVGKIFAEQALPLNKKGSQDSLQSRESYYEALLLLRC